MIFYRNESFLQQTSLFLSSNQVRVSRVHVAGLQRTKNDIVVEQVKDVLKAGTLQVGVAF